MDQWRNKVAIVTSASSTIGAEICRALCSHQVIVVGLTPHLDQLDCLGEEIRENHEEAQFHAVQCDLANEQEIQTAVNYVCHDFGGVDVLVNSNGCAGMSQQLLQESAETVIRTSILGVLSITRKAYQSMVDRGTSGYIINVSATMDGGEGDIDRTTTSSICAASKAAVDTFTAELGKELCLQDKPTIRVTSISAGDVQRDGEGAAFCAADGPALRPKDIADTVAYCLSTPAHVQVKDIQLGAVVAAGF